MLNLKSALHLVVEGVVAECIGFVGLANVQILLKQKGVTSASSSHFELVFPCIKIVVILSLARVFFMFGGKSE